MSLNDSSVVRELNICIAISKMDSDVHLSVTMDEAGIHSSAKKIKYSKVNEEKACVSLNSENSTKTGDIYNAAVINDNGSDALMQSALNSVVFIDALETIPALERKCAKLGVKANFDVHKSSVEKKDLKCYGQYEVDRILDHDWVRHLYLIKWKGYDLEYNTWEPIDHLGGIAGEVHNFRLMELKLNRPNQVAYKKLLLLSCMLDEILSPENEDMYILLKLNGNSSPADLPKLKRDLKTKSSFVRECLKNSVIKFQINYNSILKKAMTDLRIDVAFESIENLREMLKGRKSFVTSLKIWELDVNRQIAHKGAHPIQIENNFDFDLPTNDFTYITKCIAGPDVTISEEPSWFCNCDNNCLANKNCCPSMNNSSHIYDEHGRLVNHKQTTIFECNSKCKCTSSCPNRVIQNGREFKLGLFKTGDGRGWGVKALEKIPKGQFVVEYVGEIVMQEEAERRWKLGVNPFHKTYLFDLEYQDGSNCRYVVDGAKFGNISRFINHSCSPNMEVFMFWVDNPDINMPRVALFSHKFVAKGEEITFDYRMTAPPGLVHTNRNDDGSVVKVPCKCMSKKCRKFLF